MEIIGVRIDMNKDRRKGQGSSMGSIARDIGDFGKDFVLDTAGELLDLGLGTLVGLGTFGLHTHKAGEFNPRRRATSVQSRRRRSNY